MNGNNLEFKVLHDLPPKAGKRNVLVLRVVEIRMRNSKKICLEVRKFFVAKDGSLHPTKKGIVLSKEHVEHLFDYISEIRDLIEFYSAEPAHEKYSEDI